MPRNHKDAKAPKAIRTFWNQQYQKKKQKQERKH